MSVSSEGSLGPRTPFDVLIVKEFMDVFSNELLELPLPWKVEFGIELVPGAVPILKAPYCLSLTELKELKKQLEELLERGFVHPSSSP